jgi:hypothetical protein
MKTTMETAPRRRWMAVMAVIFSSTNAYTLYSNRPRRSHSPAVYYPPTFAVNRRTIVAGAGAPPVALEGSVNGNDDMDRTNERRRKLIGSATMAAASFGLLFFNGSIVGATAAAAELPDAGGLEVIKTPSGLKYLDLVPGTGRTPQYGELLSIAYTGYIKLPSGNVKKYSSEPQKFDQVTDGYLIKHGNGKTIAGLDEGLVRLCILKMLESAYLT